MPAVELARLERQIERLRRGFADSARLRREVLDLLEFYASRVRTGRTAGRTGVLRALGVPTAVMRAVETGLRAEARADRHAAAMAGESLWSIPIVEARWLAIALLEAQEASALPPWVEAWAQTADDPALLERLAGGPMRRLLADEPGLFWETVSAYLESRQVAPATVALLSLREAASSLDDGDLPRLFEVLAAAPPTLTGEAWRAQVDALRAVARRSGAETARFLVDEITRGRPGAPRLARQTLEAFPPREREQLRRALQAQS